MTHLTFEEFQAFGRRVSAQWLSEAIGGSKEDYSPVGGFIYPKKQYVEISETKNEYSIVIHGMALIGPDLTTMERLLYHSLDAREG